MRKKWEAQRIVAIPHQVSDKEFQQRLAELAQVIYSKFCQLQKLNLQATCSNSEKKEERTGRKYA